MLRLLRKKSGQSMLEYALLLGVVVAAILIMQVFVKRGFMGGLKDSADKMGEQFSAGSTTVMEKRTLDDDQEIYEEMSTDDTIEAFVDESPEVYNTIDEDVYALTKRTGGASVTDVQKSTDSATKELTTWDDYTNLEEEFDNFELDLDNN
jgi:Flp pilus assembly pilin Flp